MLYGAVGKVGLRAFAAPFSPAQLFASGEIGAWYDPSDLTTMFQDSAGTTPVTAVGQAVGLILDKSQGLALGAELVTNGDFSNGTTGWSVAGAATFTVSGGVATFTRAAFGDNVSTAVSCTVGKFYRISATVVSASGVGGRVVFNFAATGSATTGTVADSATPGTYTAIVQATATTMYLSLASTGNGIPVSYDNISIKEIAGNHASQSTSTSRPTLSARVNLLTYSEQFDNAAWTKSNATVSANAIAAPDGANTADLIYPSTSGDGRGLYRTFAHTSSVNYTYKVYAKAAGKTVAYVATDNTAGNGVYFNLGTGAVGTATAGYTGSITSVGNGWYICSISYSGGTALSYPAICVVNSDNSISVTANGTDGIYIWGADLRVTNQGTSLPVYQRIAAATDYDTTGFPYYLSFDGTDDFLVTGTINPGSVDKAQVFAGVRKLNDATSAVITEWSADIGTINGGFILMGPRSTGAIFSYHSKGTLLSQAISTASFAAPTTNVLTGISDISGDNATLRVNGIVNIAKTDDQGTGNFSSQVLYIGSRGGTAARFTGNIYSLIVRFSATNLSDSVISQAETWVNTKTLAY